MFPAVEIAWIDALRVAALLPEIPAVPMPIAAGEALRRGSAEEEDIFFEGGKRWEKKEEICSAF